MSLSEKGFPGRGRRATIPPPFRDVAQSGSALQWGCRGRGFKSRRPDSRRPANGRPRCIRPKSPDLRRPILHRSIAVLLLAGLAACGGSSDDKSRPGPAGFSAALGVDTTSMKKTPSGLRYEDVALGEGKEASANKTVSVHYTGWLPNGEKFDSSRDRNQPFSF